MLKTGVTEKIDIVRKIIRETEGCVVAFSGGVDSTLVLELAVKELGDRVLAVIANSPAYSKKEMNQAVRWVSTRGIPYKIIRSCETENINFRKNPPERCYFCKIELFSQLKKISEKLGFKAVLDGTNADDKGDWRPGLKAGEELGVISPLKEAGLKKDEIREAVRLFIDENIAEKPSMACLASRFPYGEEISDEKLKVIEIIEDFLSEAGFSNYRARYHNVILRIEVPEKEVQLLFRTPIREELIKIAKKCGFKYVTADIEGFRSGSMNRVLDFQ